MTAPEPFFHHAPPMGPPRASNETRYLCAAAYLDADFARRVVSEVLEDEHRAVAPSTDIDAERVVRHSLRARRERLTFDVILAVLLVIGFVVVPFVTIAWILFGTALRLRGRLGWRGRTTLVGLAVVVLLCCGTGGPLLYLSYVGSAMQQELTGSDDLLGDLSLQFSVTASVAAPVALGLASLFLLFAFRVKVYGILSQEFAPGAPAVPPPHDDPRVNQRLAHVGAAQWGNLTLYGGENPFVGAGRVVDGWSAATELRPASPAFQAARDTGGGRSSVAIDPVALHQHVWQRVSELTSEALPEQERLPGLRLMHHVVAPGVRRRGDYLIDQATLLPFAVASPDAIASIARHPQGALRYYQRALVHLAGKPIAGPAGSLIAPAQSEDVAVSVFTYVAVEGAMLYTESLVTVLPPIEPRFHVVDMMAPSLRNGRAFTQALRELPWGSVGAPIRAFQGVVDRVRLVGRMDEHRTAVREQAAYPYGARTSLRELGALDEPVAYLQQLDVEKYAKLIKRRSTQALIEFLEQEGVDTSELETRVNVMYNSGVVISGGSVTGAVAAGAAASATATVTPPQREGGR